uniref:BRCA1-A complex subunit Abraxas 1 n=1 Tax=Callorhinchus milii TaxID=7868 RepID=A0A4W3IW04_CALMI
DSQLDDIEVVYTIGEFIVTIKCIFSSLFYNFAGEVDEKALKKILQDHKKNVIGWYKFRRNTSQAMTFRERLLHKNLQIQLKNQQLVFFLFTTKLCRENGSTHSLEYTLSKPQESFVQQIPVSVTNLGMSEQQDYITFSGSCTSTGYSRTVQKHSLEFFDQDGSLKEVQRIKGIYASLQEELKTTCLKVEESERSVQYLLADVQKLRKTLSEKKKELTQIPDEKKSNLMETNFDLCQALQKAFPNSKLLQSVSVTRESEIVPVQCCSEDNGIHEKDALTQVSAKSFHISASESTKISCKRKAKNCHGRLQKKQKPLRPKTRKAATNIENDGSETESLIRLTGSESEGDALGQYTKDPHSSASPTF